MHSEEIARRLEALAKLCAVIAGVDRMKVRAWVGFSACGGALPTWEVTVRDEDGRAGAEAKGADPETVLRAVEEQLAPKAREKTQARQGLLREALKALGTE